MGERLMGSLLSRSAAEKLTRSIREDGAKWLELVREAHDRKAWAALGYASWSAYVDAELPFSRATSYRLLSGAGEEGTAGPAPELSHGETINSSNVEVRDVHNRPLDAITPDAILPAPAKKSEEGSGERDASSLSKPGIDDPGSKPPSSDPLPEPSPVAPQGADDAGGSGNTPATPDDTPHSSGVAATLNERDVIGYLQGHTDAEVRAIGAPFRLAWENEIRRWATLLGISPASLLRKSDPALPSQGSAKPPQTRRQGTISRPSPAKEAAKSAARREVKSYFKAGK